MADPPRDQPHLGSNERDRGTAIVRGVLGAIPVAGPILTELVTAFIPQQRQDRIEEYIRLLEQKLSRLEQAVDRDRLRDPESIDVFEEGGFQSARATTSERREQIATLVAHGLSGGDKARIEAKRILSIMRVLDDDQILILSSYIHENRFDDAFWERHATVLRPASAHMQSDRAELDQDVMNKLARQQLLSLGLLRQRFARLKEGEMPEFDDVTGTRKVQTLDISPLGRLLLRRIGLAVDYKDRAAHPTPDE